jgi:hypothetical protein
LNNIRQDILKILAYFEYFDYPLNKEDICSFLPQHYPHTDIEEILNLLSEDKIIFRIEEFYSLQNQTAHVEKRRRGNKRALQQLEIAKKVAAILSHFPFVESIAVSGSLSKYYADEKADIDFFIITTANRLWIARTCLHLLKKLSYIVGKQSWFCMNYFVDETGMEIKEKNIFTAMEIVTLLSMQGATQFKNFIEMNSWTNNFFPPRINSRYSITEIKRGFARKFFEKIFNSRLGDFTDKWLMNLTAKRWQNKARNKKLNDHGARIGMMVNPHFSKPDPKNFQAKVVQRYEWRVNQLLASEEMVKIAL